MSKTQTILNEMTKETKWAIDAVAQGCAPDVIQSYYDCGEEMPDDMAEVFAEVALDADRVRMDGNIAAADEIRALIDKYGYDAVLKAVATFTNYA